MPTGESGNAPTRDSRELFMHDTSIQTLFGIGLRLEYCLDVLGQGPGDVQIAINDVIDDLDGLICELRERIYELR